MFAPTLRRAVAAAALMLAAGPLAAQTYPTKPIRAIVPFAAGSATDTVARVYAQRMSETLGQPIVVENRAGANGLIGADAVAKAAADGYTILFGTNSTNAAAPALFRQVPFDHEKDFAPVGFLASVPLIVTINKAVPANNLAEFIAYAKANPGKINFASASASQRVSTEMLATMAGIKLTVIPYRSSPQAITDVVSGQVQMFTADLAVTLSQVKEGNVRGLAVTSRTRSAKIPELPTVEEAGNLPGYELIAWFGLFAPANTPAAVVERLNRAVNEAAGHPDVRSRLVDGLGMDFAPSTPTELAARVKVEAAKWAKAVADAGIEKE
jgi:tripartite-type tricarboxylate transporter receptor subunit TctC